MLSLSCFKLQLWPKDATTHSALNYMSQFMIQQCMARKAHDDVHYAGSVYKFAREYAVSICDLVSFICTNNKHKISVGEPGFPVATLPCGHRVLAGKNEVFQVADCDFSNLSLIPTVILINHISESIEDSWYRGPRRTKRFVKNNCHQSLFSFEEQVRSSRYINSKIWFHWGDPTIPNQVYWQRSRTSHNISQCLDCNNCFTKIY